MVAKLKNDVAKTTKANTKVATDSIDAWQKKAITLREEAITLKRNMLSGDVQNVHAYKYKRRELAKALTRINHKKAEGEK